MLPGDIMGHESMGVVVEVGSAAACSHTTAELFGYTHLTGGYPGGRAEYLRVPFADTTHVKVPDGIDDEKLLFLSDILPTGRQAAVQPGDTVAVRGCAPVGRMTIRSATLLGAAQVIAIAPCRSGCP